MAEDIPKNLPSEKPALSHEPPIKDLYGPVLTGLPLRVFARLSSLSFVMGMIMEQNGYNALVKSEVAPSATFYPIESPTEEDKKVQETTVEALPQLLSAVAPAYQGHRFVTGMDYHRAYLAGTATPLDVAKRAVESIKESQTSQPGMNWFTSWDEGEIMKMAQESTDRYTNKAPLSVLDGVPVAVKDELSMLPFSTHCGTAMPIMTPTCDSTVVTRLREAGAMLLGLTTMTEMGCNVIGENINHGWPRNPYNTRHACSGSSAGSAATVASGLCPIAIGCDAGGSIRMPASVCGVVGLKPTYGRVSLNGIAPLTKSLGHCGPMGSSVQDVALAYQVIAGTDPADKSTAGQPPVSLVGLSIDSAKEVQTIGVFWDWFECGDPEVVDVCKAGLDQLAKETGMTVKEIKIPILQEVLTAHTCTIMSEMASAMRHNLNAHWSTFAPGTRIIMNMALAFSAQQFVVSQFWRTRAMEILKEIYDQCSVFVSPASGLTAPEITPAAETVGMADMTVTGKMMLFAPLANFTGVPALSVPVGYNKKGLPIGLQLMGPWWSETELLRLGHVLECVTTKRKPTVFYTPLTA